MGDRSRQHQAKSKMGQCCKGQGWGRGRGRGWGKTARGLPCCVEGGGGILWGCRTSPCLSRALRCTHLVNSPPGLRLPAPQADGWGASGQQGLGDSDWGSHDSAVVKCSLSEPLEAIACQTNGPGIAAQTACSKTTSLDPRLGRVPGVR